MYRKAALEAELSVSAVKREAVSLYEQLQEAEKKRDALLEEAKERGTPAQEREKLLNQVLLPVLHVVALLCLLSQVSHC